MGNFFKKLLLFISSGSKSNIAPAAAVVIDSIPAPDIIPISTKQSTTVTINTSGNRVVNENTTNLIISFEGMSKIGPDGLVHAYHDMLGYPTIGIGHLLSKVKNEDLSKYPVMTVNDAIYLLRYTDLNIFSSGISRLITCPLTDNEFGALVSLSFNVGLGNIQASTLRRKLNRGDSKTECADEFLKWDKAGGRKVAGLTRRRAAERALFLS